MSDEASTENVTLVTGNFPTVSSLKSEDSTEQLICKTPQKSEKRKSVSSKSVEAGSDEGLAARRSVVLLGLTQVVLGVLLVGGGALAVVKGAALSRVGAGLWAGCVAVVAGVVGIVAGINDCYGFDGATSSGLLTAFLALSLLCLACGNSAAVLAATGLQRDATRDPSPLNTFQDEMQAWTPVLTNIGLLIVASIHCLVCIISIYQLSRRVCSCFRPKQPFDHNQFEPGKKVPCVFHVDEIRKAQEAERLRGHQFCKELEAKLQSETLNVKKEDGKEFGSATSKEYLVSRWLGRHGSTVPRPRRPSAGIRKNRKPPAAPLVLLPAHPASTLGRMPISVVVPPRPYATLPLPPAPYAPPAQIYYPIHDTRLRRRRSPREARHERRRRETRQRDSLTRSLERIHRKRRADRDRLSDADLKRTYTGLDRAYAEQFIAVCDSSRHAAEQHDSLATTATSGTGDSSDTQNSS
ncbi:unnamed protein product [Leptosia nina]|uniref:Transmembrane protein n=1 Tax=Leptosia nina TaxID=320188 RepID=A0AAV1JD77_9NEOP